MRPLLAGLAGGAALVASLASGTPVHAATKDTFAIRGMASPSTLVVNHELHASASITAPREMSACIVTEIQDPSKPVAQRTVATERHASTQLAPGWPLTFYQDWTPTHAGSYATVASVYDATCHTLLQRTQTSSFTVSGANVMTPRAATTAWAEGQRAFSASSSWNTPVPATASYGALAWPAASNPWVYYANWRDVGAPPVYVAKAGDPTVTVTVQSASNWGRSTAPVKLRIPAGADGSRGWYVSSAGGAKWFGDGELVVVDGTTAWQFHEFRRTSATTATVNVYGRADVRTDSGWGSHGVGAGTTAAGSSELAGLLTGADADSATINHALQLVVDSCSNVAGQPVGEAINADGDRNADGSAHSGSGCSPAAKVLLHEGQRLAIPSTMQASQVSGLSPLGRKLFTALQKYGAYDIDSDHGPQALLRVQANAFDDKTNAALQADMARLLPLLHTVSTTNSTTKSTAPTAPTTPVSHPGDVVWRQSGRFTAWTDPAGHVWQPRGANVTTGGRAAVATDTVTASVAKASVPGLYASMVNNADAWSVPTGNGTFRVQLFTTEDWFSKAGQRVWNVDAEGARKLTGVDPVAATGGKDRADEPTFTATVTDGTLNLSFQAVANLPDIAGIQVTRVS